MKKIYIGSKSGIDAKQLNSRINLQVSLENKYNHPNISFLCVEIQPPGNFNRDLTFSEKMVISDARKQGFIIGFESPHLWNGRDIDPCQKNGIKDLLEIAEIAKSIEVDYFFSNPGDLFSKTYDHFRWQQARDAHLECYEQLAHYFKNPGIENTNPIRHLEDCNVQGFFGMFPEDLNLFNFIVWDIAHAQFVVNNFNIENKIECIDGLKAIHKRDNLTMNDFIEYLEEKIKVVHVGNATGLGDIVKEGLKLLEGDADCDQLIRNIILNRKSPIFFISEPSPIPYNLNYESLIDIMASEEKLIFNICIKEL